jgi:DNA helicase HerA-like ATPase
VECGVEGPGIGWFVGVSLPLQSQILLRKGSLLRNGAFVVADGPEGCTLGVVERVESGHLHLDESIREAEQVENALSYTDIIRDQVYRRASVRWLALLEPLISRCIVTSPSMPIDPPAEVYEAPTGVLRRVFRSGRGWIRLGVLARNPSVEFSIDVNKLGRHLAILAVTGGGKSNTVSIMAHRIVSGLGGTMVIFDIHGEYARMAQSLAPGRALIKEPKINPYTLSFQELKKLARIPEGAHVQERILRQAWHCIVSPGDPECSSHRTLVHRQTGNIGFLDLLRQYAQTAKAAKSRPDSLQGLLNRIDDIEENYGSVLDERYHSDLTLIIEPGRLNIFDLSGIDEIGADAVVSHYLRRLLEERKRFKREGAGYPVPILVVIEEAHVLIPREESTLTRYWAGRVAREGRKFGIGLVLVSQRPKNVDPDVLSQTNNKIILRIVEPTDQRYVQAASEQLSEDLIQLLPSLNPGEAIVLGSMTRLPAVVRIDYCGEVCRTEPGGADIDFVGEWERHARAEHSSLIERELEEID